ncbi:MAG: hypothetical protein JO212_06025 [Acetobacteraceae bacterium]|nr:hypothetical protein [Acetobacteraceae bacterium]
MILSKLHRFIFIKGVKVGGTSVEIALSTICGPEDILCPITPIDELRRLEVGSGARNYSADRTAELAYLKALRRAAISDLAKFPMPAAACFNHMPLRDVFEMQGPYVSEYRVLCIERNPYAKIISWANHMLSFDNYQIGGEMRADWRAVKNYLDRAVEDGSITAVKNIDRYRHPDGSIPAQVMRFENLDCALQQFVNSLGIKHSPRLPHAKKGILADSLDPRELLDQRQIKMINQIFRDEFETFQYEPL